MFLPGSGYYVIIHWVAIKTVNEDLLRDLLIN